MTIMDSVEVKDDDLSSESSVKDNSGSSDEDEVNSGWADAVSKILKHKSKKKSIVLSKAKKLTDVRKKEKALEFEIEPTDDLVKKEDTLDDDVDVKPEIEEPVRKKAKTLPHLRIKPDILEKGRERLLQKIATKGVVQLFNAVKMQQKDISKKLEEAGPLEVRKEKVLKNLDKRAFLDVLMGEKSQRIDTETDRNQEKTENVTTWSVLKEDFMMGAKMKDWDKELEIENDEVI